MFLLYGLYGIYLSIYLSYSVIEISTSTEIIYDQINIIFCVLVVSIYMLLLLKIMPSKKATFFVNFSTFCHKYYILLHCTFWTCLVITNILIFVNKLNYLMVVCSDKMAGD